MMNAFHILNVTHPFPVTRCKSASCLEITMCADANTNSQTSSNQSKVQAADTTWVVFDNCECDGEFKIYYQEERLGYISYLPYSN